MVPPLTTSAARPSRCTRALTRPVAPLCVVQAFIETETCQVLLRAGEQRRELTAAIKLFQDAQHALRTVRSRMRW